MNFRETLQNKKIMIPVIITVLLLAVAFAVVMLFFWKWEIGDGYYKKANKIYFNNKLVTEHLENFKLLGYGFAKNKNHVFYLGKDFSTDVDFQKLISKNLIATTESIYYFDGNDIKRIRGVDGKTFELLNNSYGKDKDLYYYIDSQDSNNFTCVKPEFINDNEEYDIQCGDSYFKQGQFVKYTVQYQSYLDAEKTRKEYEDANQPKNNKDMLKELFGGELSDYEFQTLNVSNVVCDESLENAIRNTSTYSRYGGLQINDKEFSSEYSCSKFNKECENVEAEKIKIADEVNNNVYNIVNGCLYKKGGPVFEHNLLVKRMQGYFNNVKGAGIGRVWDGIEEFHRIEESGYLYIYLYGYAGCGGCIFNGPYLKINLSTGDVSGGSSDIPFLPNIFISPNDSKAIEVSFDGNIEKSEIKLYLYDFINDKRTKSIYTIPQDKTILEVGDGTYPIKDSINWLDENVIQLQLYKRSNEKWEEAIARHEEKDGRSNFMGYEVSGKPIILKVE